MIEQLALILAALVLAGAYWELRHLRQLAAESADWKRRALEAEEDARGWYAAHQRELQACADAYAKLSAYERELAVYRSKEPDNGRTWS